MAQPFEAQRDPFAFGRRLHQNLGSRPVPQDGREALTRRRHAIFRELACLAQHVDLTFSLMDVDANMIHG
jgi:hypothetical protein